jgi:hypothetical protein
MGNWVSVPPHDHVLTYANIDVSPSLIGRVMAVLYQQPRVHVDLLLDNGTIGHYRLVSATAGDGVLVSEYLTSPDDYAALFQALPVRAIKAVRVTTTNEAAFNPEVSYRFFSDGQRLLSGR